MTEVGLNPHATTTNGHSRGLAEMPFPAMPTLMQHQRMVAEWNRNFAVGQKVHVRMDSGAVLDSVTTSAAWMLGGHTAVIMVQDISGGFLLSRITACA